MRSVSGLLGIVLAVLFAVSGCGGSTNQAQVRLLNVSQGYSSLDLYDNNNNATTNSDALVVGAVLYPTISSYVGVDSGTYTVDFRTTGVSSDLSTLSAENWTDSSHQTYVAFGSNGHFADLKIAEDAADPDSGKTDVTVLNATTAGSVDVYLTDAATALSDASPTWTAVGNGGVSSKVEINSGAYRLRVTATGNAADVRLDTIDANVTFSSAQVASVILGGTPGGVLVNGFLLPQQGQLTPFLNPMARIRGSVGIANGTQVTGSVGGVNILSDATVGVIASTYSLVTAGSASVALTVDGNPVTAAAQTLNPGGDYTLLVWSDANGTETTLIADDNNPPTLTGYSKVRLMNGMSAFAAPVSMNVDFATAASNVPVGQASASTQVPIGTDLEVDVLDASTSAILKSMTTVTLEDQGVYTMFVAGSASAVSGTLRKDR